MTGIAFVTAALFLFAWARSAWISGERTRERDEARTDRDTYACKLADLHNQQADTQRLPAWPEFLDPSAAHDRAITDLMEQQFQDGTP